MEVIGSPTMPESGLRDHLDHLWDMVVGYCFSTVAVRFTHCGENGRETCVKAFLEAIGSLTMPVSGLVAYFRAAPDIIEFMLTP